MEKSLCRTAKKKVMKQTEYHENLTIMEGKNQDSAFDCRLPVRVKQEPKNPQLEQPLNLIRINSGIYVDFLQGDSKPDPREIGKTK